MKSFRNIVPILFLVLSLSGCLMVREGDLKPPAQWPLQSPSLGKKSISLSVNRGADSDGTIRETTQDTAKLFREQAARAYTESGLFSSVTVEGEPADIKADISIVEEGSEGLAFLSGFISGFTFGMIPGYASEDLIAKTVYKDRAHKVLANVDKKEELGFWIQLFLIFAMPFSDEPEDVVKSAHYDLHRLTIDEAYAKGIF